MDDFGQSVPPKGKYYLEEDGMHLGEVEIVEDYAIFAIHKKDRDKLFFTDGIIFQLEYNKIVLVR